MNVKLIKRDPEAAYVSDMLWLPLAKIPVKAIKDGLQYWDVEKGISIQRSLWKETEHHLICPREFIHPSEYPQFDFPFVDITPKQFPKAEFYVPTEPRDDEQRAAYSALLAAKGGVLNLACGKGKTFLSLKRAAAEGCPLLVIAHNSYLLDQWRREEIPKHVILPPGEIVGIIKESTLDWEHCITVASIQTLALRWKEGKIPPEMRRHFGMVVFDEVHHLSAPLFANTAPIILGKRFGLTATQKRVDGLEFIYKSHIGDVFYTDLTQTLIPRIYFQLTPISVNLDRKEVRDVAGNVNMGMLNTFVGKLEESNLFRAKCIKEALNEGRKVICVSKSKDQLINLHKMFPGSGLIVEETPAEQRSEIVRNSRVSFAISSLGAEGLNDPTLDAIFILLPLKSPYYLQQLLGRVQREVSGKKTPVVVIFDDTGIRPYRAMCKIMKDHFNKWDKHVPGMPPLTYSILHAEK